MKPYSELNLLRVETDEETEDRKGLFSFLFKRWVVRNFPKAKITVVIPNNTFQHTIKLCKAIRAEADLYIEPTTVINALYLDFTHRYLFTHKVKDLYKELTQYDYMFGDLVISDPINNKIYTYPKEGVNKAIIECTLDKGKIETGELFLSELYEITGRHLTVEDLLTRIWVNFIKDNEGHNIKAIRKLIKMMGKVPAAL
ncbi:hypothetical protein SFC65_24320 [Priestia filamentosa]|uniref:hypothetical protein n=1 Tax=Priestia filamentosa TaxID=1402861 RepID=UPI003982677B